MSRSSRLNAGPHVSVSRRQFLGTSALTIAIAGMTSFSGVEPALAQAKKSKQEAQYQDAPKDGQQCSKCKHFKNGKCDIVEGDISPNGWCKFFEAKS